MKTARTRKSFERAGIKCWKNLERKLEENIMEIDTARNQREENSVTLEGVVCKYPKTITWESENYLQFKVRSIDKNGRLVIPTCLYKLEDMKQKDYLARRNIIRHNKRVLVIGEIGLIDFDTMYEYRKHVIIIFVDEVKLSE